MKIFKRKYKIKKWGHLPTLPRPCERSTIGLEELNGRIRNGNGCGLLSMSTPTNTPKTYNLKLTTYHLQT